MIELGYALSSEEHPPVEIVKLARAAEDAGFSFALISDHFHPWTDRQGESGFVWSMIGAIAHATERLRLGTGVTCPTMRVHPAIVAQAAATCASLMPGRFFLGVGTGEALNEHIFADHWPSPQERLAMLEEAVGLIRELWGGDLVSHDGKHYVVDRARIYSLPNELPPIYVAAAAPDAAELAGRIGDGLVSTSPEREIVQTFESAGGGGPRYGQLTVCYAESEDEAVQTALEWWPNAALKGPLGQELALPSMFEASAEMVDEEAIADAVVCGPDADLHRKKIREFEDAGFDHVYIHQVGLDQDGFMRFYAEEILGAFASATR
ncbi:MAG: TIGR03557 family F420-dependent LLM class oxidoreductase [Actinobacteria bacterium]|nr:TIGR03557 family F420-dependent LLM class oxidoreductase [Actinomycetota bacterium]